MIGIILTLVGAIAVIGLCAKFSNRPRVDPMQRYNLAPRGEIQDFDRVSLMEESALGIAKLDFAEWQLKNESGNSILVMLMDTVEKSTIAMSKVPTTDKTGKLSVAAIERGIQQTQAAMVAKEVAKRNRAAAISDLVNKYNGKSA